MNKFIFFIISSMISSWVIIYAQNELVIEFLCIPGLYHIATGTDVRCNERKCAHGGNYKYYQSYSRPSLLIIVIIIA